MATAVARRYEDEPDVSVEIRSMATVVKGDHQTDLVETPPLRHQEALRPDPQADGRDAGCVEGVSRDQRAAENDPHDRRTRRCRQCAL